MTLDRVVVQRHAITMKNLGRALVHFSSSLTAQSAVRKLDQKKCLGNLITARLLGDEECDRLDENQNLPNRSVNGSNELPKSHYDPLSVEKPEKLETHETHSDQKHGETSSKSKEASVLDRGLIAKTHHLSGYFLSHKSQCHQITTFYLSTIDISTLRISLDSSNSTDPFGHLEC
jgi:hypothetical protein